MVIIKTIKSKINLDHINLINSIFKLTDSYTVEHQKRVSKLAVCIAKNLKLSKEKIKMVDKLEKLEYELKEEIKNCKPESKEGLKEQIKEAKDSLTKLNKDELTKSLKKLEDLSKHDRTKNNTQRGR